MRPPLLATFGTRVDRPRFGMAGEGVTAMIVAADAGDNPLADRREDRKAAAERERKAKVAKVASQATNAMAAVRAQLDLREKGAADKAANKANDDARAPVRASSTMVERAFAARIDGPDKYVRYQTTLTLTRHLGPGSPVHARARRADRVAR